jgi:TolB protein
MLSTRLTVGGDVQLNAWSPDGTWIAYDSFTGEVQGESWGDIYVIRADGTNPVNLTPGAARGAEPAWSPDGSQIAFTGEVDGVWEVFVMQADGSNPVRLTDLRAAMPNSRYWPTAYEPAWSPDGTRIAFSATGEQADNTIWLMNADGSDLTQLTDDLPAYQAWRPSWSPDGSRIAYWAYRPDDGLCYQIYAMEADGSNPTNITNHDSCNENPAWSPAE